MAEYKLVTGDKKEKVLNSSKDFSGAGTCTYPNGDTFEGEWVNGLRCCKNGVYTYANAPAGAGEEGGQAEAPETYSGEWLNNDKHGIGKQNYHKLGHYYGHWQNGDKHGEGVMIYVNKDIYSGEWKCGNKEGKGTYIFAETGMKFIGSFKSGNLTNGRWEYPNGSYYQGNFDNNQPKGVGKWHFENGNVVEGVYTQMKRADVDTDQIKLAWKTISDITCKVEPSQDGPRAAEQLKSVPDVKLSYFGAYHARGEPIRQLLVHSGADWENDLVQFQDWPAMKPTVPGNALPCVTFKDGSVLGDSHPITRKLGEQYGYYPQDPETRKEIDALMEDFDGFFSQAVGSIAQCSDAAEKKELMDEQMSEAIPAYLQSINSQLARGEWLVGNKMTIVDFWVAGCLYTGILGNPHSEYPKEQREEILDLFPHFRKYGERYSSTIQSYLDSRPARKL